MAQKPEKRVPSLKIQAAEEEMIKSLSYVNASDFNTFMESWKDSKGFLQSIPCEDLGRLKIVELGVHMDLHGIHELILTTETVLYTTFQVLISR